MNFLAASITDFRSAKAVSAILQSRQIPGTSFVVGLFVSEELYNNIFHGKEAIEHLLNYGPTINHITFHKKS